jgi:hypothetical protein
MVHLFLHPSPHTKYVREETLAPGKALATSEPRLKSSRTATVLHKDSGCAAIGDMDGQQIYKHGVANILKDG